MFWNLIWQDKKNMIPIENVFWKTQAVWSQILHDIWYKNVQNGNWIHLGMSHKQESGILTVGNMPTVKHIIE